MDVNDLCYADESGDDEMSSSEYDEETISSSELFNRVDDVRKSSFMNKATVKNKGKNWDFGEKKRFKKVKSVYFGKPVEESLRKSFVKESRRRSRTPRKSRDRIEFYKRETSRVNSGKKSQKKLAKSVRKFEDMTLNDTIEAQPIFLEGRDKEIVKHLLRRVDKEEKRLRKKMLKKKKKMEAVKKLKQKQKKKKKRINQLGINKIDLGVYKNDKDLDNLHTPLQTARFIEENLQLKSPRSILNERSTNKNRRSRAKMTKSEIRRRKKKRTPKKNTAKKSTTKKKSKKARNTYRTVTKKRKRVVYSNCVSPPPEQSRLPQRPTINECRQQTLQDVKELLRRRISGQMGHSPKPVYTPAPGPLTPNKIKQKMLSKKRKSKIKKTPRRRRRKERLKLFTDRSNQENVSPYKDTTFVQYKNAINELSFSQNGNSASPHRLFKNGLAFSANPLDISNQNEQHMVPRFDRYDTFSQLPDDVPTEFYDYPTTTARQRDQVLNHLDESDNIFKF
jgi:hypothetical protein